MANPAIIFGGSDTSKHLQKNVNHNDIVIKKHDSFAAANNVSATNVTGLNLTGFRGASIDLTVSIDATADLFATFKLTAIVKAATAFLAVEYIGDETNITFSITSGGQIQYASGNETGFASSTFKWSASLMED